MKHITISILTAILFLISPFLKAQTGWYSLPPPGSNDFRVVWFTDANNGIAGNYRTTDSGLNWTQILAYSSYGIFFINSSTGYCVSSNVLKTTNFGTNWENQYTPTGSDVLYGVYFTDANTGYATSEFAEIIKTTNGGENWAIMPCGVSSVYRFHDVFFTNSQTGFVCGMEQNDFTSVILKTTNAGVNWTRQDFPGGTGFISICFMSPSTGIAAGLKIRKTTDGGNTWDSIPAPFLAFYGPVVFPSPSLGYALAGGNRIVKTTTGGNSWFEQASNTSAILEDIYFVNDNTGFICGYNGKILKTTDGGGPPIGITPISTETPSMFMLEQNYPNPFNPSTNIKFSIPEKSSVKIKIYDISGRFIEELIDFELHPGKYSAVWDASGLAGGVYFYTISAGSYKESRKMILLK